MIVWAASWQNQQSGMCAQRRLRSAWASAQSDQSLRCPHEESWVLSYPLSAQQRLWSDWVDVQADLSLRWAYMPFCWFFSVVLFCLFRQDHSLRRWVYGWCKHWYSQGNRIWAALKTMHGWKTVSWSDCKAFQTISQTSYLHIILILMHLRI